MKTKRPFPITIDDFLILLGFALLMLGAYLFDWRLALMLSGIIVMLASSVRLKNKR